MITHDQQEVISANNIQISEVMKLIETDAAGPVRLGSLFMQPLAQIETIDGYTKATPITYRRKSLFHDGQIAAFGIIYDSQGESVKKMVAKIPSDSKRWLESTIGDGPLYAGRCSIKLITLPDVVKYQAMSSWNSNDLKFLGKKGIRYPKIN